LSCDPNLCDLWEEDVFWLLRSAIAAVEDYGGLTLEVGVFLGRFRLIGVVDERVIYIDKIVVNGAIAIFNIDVVQEA